MEVIKEKTYNGLVFKTIKASEGYTFRRKSDQQEFGNEITLGYTYYIGGKKLEQPKWEVPEDYEEIEIKREVVENANI